MLLRFCEHFKMKRPVAKCSPMFPSAMLRAAKFLAGLLVAYCASAHGVSAVPSDYSQKPVAELVDELTEIDSPVPWINSASIGLIPDAFITDKSTGSPQGSVVGLTPPEVPAQMSELVRRGPIALPELINHLSDIRPTRLQLGTESSDAHAFMFMYFSDEYDPRVGRWFPEEGRRQFMAKLFEGRYTVKVADVCFVLIGQIVNRRLIAVRYQPSGGLVVNSPIEASVLAAKVKNDWGNVDAEGLRQSLLEDIHGTKYPESVSQAEYTERFVNPALSRLKFYFPDAYGALRGDDLKRRKEFEKQATGSRP